MDRRILDNFTTFSKKLEKKNDFFHFLCDFLFCIAESGCPRHPPSPHALSHCFNDYSLIVPLFPRSSSEFKNHIDLPKARIKRIMQVMMQADDRCPHVRMIRAEAPLLFAKACELFILELSLRAYRFSVIRQRKNLSQEDIRQAVSVTKTLDFIAHILNEQDADAAAASDQRSSGESGTAKKPRNNRNKASAANGSARQSQPEEMLVSLFSLPSFVVSPLLSRCVLFIM